MSPIPEPCLPPPTCSLQLQRGNSTAFIIISTILSMCACTNVCACVYKDQRTTSTFIPQELFVFLEIGSLTDMGFIKSAKLSGQQKPKDPPVFPSLVMGWQAWLFKVGSVNGTWVLMLLQLALSQMSHLSPASFPYSICFLSYAFQSKALLETFQDIHKKLS